jgi:hypothetical protein
MQDKYVGDVGDFGKFILLSGLTSMGKEPIKLGINWYHVTKPDQRKGDGRHTDYLDATWNHFNFYRECSPNIHGKLKNIVDADERKISALEKGGLLPDSTIYYSEPVPYEAKFPDQRMINRKQWFENSKNVLKDSDIVFLDPDNGIRPFKVKKTQMKAIKYAFDDEIKEYYQEGKSVILYNHRDYSPKQKYDGDKLLRIKDFIHSNTFAVLRFKRISVRDYVFLMQKKHEDLFMGLFNQMLSKPKDYLFERYEI